MLMVKGAPGSGVEITTGYRTTASAVLIARDRIVDEQLLPGYDFNPKARRGLALISFTVMFDQCDETMAVGHTISMIRDMNVDVILGPTCSYRKF
ncbi:unnamed protein product [Strongylus vulgaris]|uniref:Receptor ligand binding region domain-containing protein n=1 Tax=Strongylus vulgaris TaxID=40348 RepID=A0A3P7KK69_STRVU|nr:unnamed protein product [Strongylus vulgaris]